MTATATITLDATYLAELAEAWRTAEVRDYTAADFVHDQTRRLDWTSLRALAYEDYGIDQEKTWRMPRPELIAALVRIERQRERDEAAGAWLAS